MIQQNPHRNFAHSAILAKDCLRLCFLWGANLVAECFKQVMPSVEIQTEQIWIGQTCWDTAQCTASVSCGN